MEWCLCDSCVNERIWSLQSARGECDITKSCPLWAFSTCWKTLLTKWNFFLKKINQLGQFSFSYFFKCLYQSVSLLPTLTALSSKCDDDWWWHLRVQTPWQAQEAPWGLVCQTDSHLPFSPRSSQSCSRALWPKLSSQAAWKDRCQQLLLEFFVSNSARDPSAPTSRYCWEAEPCRVLLCEEASGCDCSAPNQHVGLCHPTHFVQLQWPCPHHSDTWHTSVFCQCFLLSLLRHRWGEQELYSLSSPSFQSMVSPLCILKSVPCGICMSRWH